MKYFKIHVIEGIPQIGALDFTSIPRIFYLNNNSAIVEVSEPYDQIIPDVIEEVSKEDFEQLFNIESDEESIKQSALLDLKLLYLALIKEADLLGNMDEKTRLQSEFLQKKAEIEKAPEA